MKKNQSVQSVPDKKPSFPPAMINIHAEFIFDPEKIKALMVKHGVTKSLEEPKGKK